MFSIHCKECGSESVVLIGAIAEWDMKAQGWRIEDMNNPSFICGECQHEDNECDERLIEE